MRQRSAAVCLLAALIGACAPAAPVGQPASTPRPASVASSAPAGTSPTPAAPPSAPRALSGIVTVEAGDNFFSVPQIMVMVGTTVVWRVVGQSAHDVRARDGSFASPLMGLGGTFTRTFTRPGRYSYFCTPHDGDGMAGGVDVVQ